MITADGTVTNEELTKMELWELLSLFESALAVKVKAFEGWEPVTDHHNQITTEAKATAILALLRA